ncbi:uncharacterized protein JCM6883_004171 [Sporobolomyces salmoneus]|uniref:uncharacterized protein n=1 Tax=Sporobolomyces salmoneus TaxID=183962 RepID=UPI003177C615
MASRCFIDFAAGDQARYDHDYSQYKALEKWLAQNGAKYGLPEELNELDEASRETLTAMYEAETKTTLTASSFSPPASLRLPRLYITVRSDVPGLRKTTSNFLDLLTDSKKLKSKRSPNPPLKYAGSKVFRIEEGFVAQTGDVTRQDGSGGESIYGGTFNDEKEGLKTAFELGTIAMANSGKNSNTSQFFVTLTSDPAKLKKLTGKYVAFGQADLSIASSRECIDGLSSLGDGKGGTKEPVWIEECNVCQ